MPAFANNLMSLDGRQGKPWGGHLVLVCDNCNGQNKNRMVLRYIVYLVETLKFEKVTLIFLIAGHTKNPCDRLFNLLKYGYRKRNIFDVDSLVAILNENSFVSAERFDKMKFRDWDTFFDSYYAKPSQKVNKWHIFEVNSTLPGRKDPRTIMTYRRSAREGVESAWQQYKKRNSIPQVDRDSVLGDIVDYPITLKPPGIRSIKKNELFTKYRKMVPEQYRNSDIYLPPSQEESNELKKQKAAKDAAKAVEKAARKRRYEEATAV